ncbi:MAG: OsmC family protein [Candidatus Binatia bacterium]
MESTSYQVSVTWMNGREGWAECPGLQKPLKFSAPAEFGGRPGLWSPQSMLVLAASSCFMSTLLALAEGSKLSLVGFQADAEGQLEKIPDQGYHFTEVVLHPRVEVAKDSDVGLAQQLLEKSEQACIVAKALAVPVRVEPQVKVVTPAVKV